MTRRFPECRREAQAVAKTSDVAPLALASILLGPYANRLARLPEHSSIVHRVANKIGNAAVRRHSNIDPSASTASQEAIEEIYKGTSFWHGTGRYQYREDGSTTDVLRKILQQDGLLPRRDLFDPVKGEMQTVSLAQARMYARAYADMHGKGDREPERYGTSTFWSMYFIGSCAVDSALEMKLHTKAGRQQFQQFRTSERANPTRWWDKVHSSMWGIFAPFKFGSDIEDNYPIVVGVRSGTVQPIDTSRITSIHEVRTDQPLGIDAFTHLETPRARIPETQDMLSEFGYNTLPIVPIEDAEAHASRIPFLELVRPVNR